MLDGGNDRINRSEVTEAYLRFGLSERVSVNIDVQRLRDTYNPEGERRVEGWVSGFILSSEF